MNYYKRHLGDYAKDAGHLTLMEHGAFTLLLDRYYAQEGPISQTDAYRITHARSKEERAAVDTVLADFFHEADGEWTNSRADAELGKYREQAEKNREIAVKREATKRATNGARSVLKACSKRATNEQPSHKPLAINHKEQKQDQEIGSPNGSRLAQDWALPDDWREWAEAERPDVDAQAQASMFADYWHGVAGAKGRKADWQATWRNWIRRADGMARGHRQQPEKSKTLTAIEVLEGMKNELDGKRTNHGVPETSLLAIGSSASR